MNRVLGDYFETLLYKIFVSIDEHTSVSEVICNSDLIIFSHKECKYNYLMNLRENIR